jgi:PAS domain S-box-containing protein
MHSEPSPAPTADFPGRGEMAARMRATDWAATPVGPVASWPSSLRTAVHIVLGSRHPMFVWWGPRLVNFYNDAYAPILGKRHPAALGRPARDAWADIWADVGPLADAVARGESTWNDRLKLVMERNGYPEETYFTFSYSPAPDDAGGVGGLFCACSEETDRVLADRRLALLRELAAATADARSVADVCRAATDVLGRHPQDVPFALIYLPDVADGRRVRLAAAVGIEPGSPLAPTTAVVSPDAGTAAGGTAAGVTHAESAAGLWPFDRAAAGRPSVVPGLAGYTVSACTSAAAGPADPSTPVPHRAPVPHTAVVLALTGGGRDHPGGFLVAGVSPLRPVDAGYLGFADLLASNLAGALAAAGSHEGQQRLLAALEAERARLAEVFRRSPAFTAVLRGPTQVFELANDRYYQLVGHRTVIGRPIREALPEVAGQGFFELLDRVYATGEPFVGRDMAAQLEREPGQPLAERVVEFVFQPLLDPDGAVDGILVHGVDLTEHKRAEAAVRRSEERFRAAFEQADVGMVLCDLRGRVTRANPAFCRLTGYPEAEMVGRTSGHMTHPDDRSANVDFVSTLADGTRPSVVFEKRYLRKGDGHVVWAQASVSLVRDAAGDPAGMMAFVQDVSGRKRAEADLRESEERLRVAVEIAQLGTFEIDLRTEAVAVNDAGRAIFGWPAGVAPTVGRVRADVHPDDRDDVVRQVRAALADGGPGRFEVEHRIVRPDGATRWVRVRGRAAFDAGAGVGGAAARCVGTYLDITARREAALRRESLLAAERAARAEAERAGRIKDEFLATLSHELRTPLNAILGWAQIVRRTPAEAETVAEGMAVIERNARAQSRIVDDLLDMSRIISGKLRVEFQPVDLATVVAAAVDTVRPTADAKGVRLHADLAGRAAPVSGDPNRLQQVFWNLVTNAVKFTTRGGRVGVSLEGGETQWVVRVADTGEGIVPEFLPHVFDRFRQADAGTTRRHGGLGLGLAIVKQLVELHGGSAQAASPGPGLGTTLTVTVPALVEAVDSPDANDHNSRAPLQLDMLAGEGQPAGMAALGEGGPPAWRGTSPPSVEGTPMLTADLRARLVGLNVLVVDDEADARGLVRRLFEECGAVVTTAASAAEAVERVVADRPDLLVSDIGMPDEDGYSLIRRVRLLTEDGVGGLPAVALTAYAGLEDRERAVSAGFQEHVAKPVEPAKLLATAARLAGRLGAPKSDPNGPRYR